MLFTVDVLGEPWPVFPMDWLDSYQERDMNFPGSCTILLDMRRRALWLATNPENSGTDRHIAEAVARARLECLKLALPTIPSNHVEARYPGASRFRDMLASLRGQHAVELSRKRGYDPSLPLVTRSRGEDSGWKDCAPNAGYEEAAEIFVSHVSAGALDAIPGLIRWGRSIREMITFGYHDGAVLYRMMEMLNGERGGRHLFEPPASKDYGNPFGKLADAFLWCAKTMTLAEVAEKWEVPPNTVAGWCDSGELDEVVQDKTGEWHIGAYAWRLHCLVRDYRKDRRYEKKERRKQLAAERRQRHK